MTDRDLTKSRRRKVANRAGEERLGGSNRFWLIFMGLIGIGAAVVAVAWPGIAAVPLRWVIAF